MLPRMKGANSVNTWLGSATKSLPAKKIGAAQRVLSGLAITLPMEAQRH